MERFVKAFLQNELRGCCQGLCETLENREELPQQAPPLLLPSGFHFDGQMGLSSVWDTSRE